MAKMALLACVGLFAAGCSSVALVQKDEWERQKTGMEELKIEVARLKDEVAKSTQEQRLLKADMSVFFADLKTSVSRVSGQVEESKFDLKNLSKTTEKLSERKYIIKGGTTDSSAQGDSVIVADKVDVQKLFKIARQDFNAKDWDRAVKEFEEILARYPKDEMADDCLYWVGEIRYVRRQYPEAVAQYNRIAKEYPSSNTVPAAMYKVGLCHEKLKDEKAMKKAFLELIEKYPDSDEAGLARARTSP